MYISDDVPEGCTQQTYKALALTLLACYSTDTQLVESSEMLDKVPFFTQVISGCFRYINIVNIVFYIYMLNCFMVFVHV